MIETDGNLQKRTYTTRRGERVVSGQIPTGEDSELVGMYRYISIAPTFLRGGDTFVIDASVTYMLSEHSPWPDWFPYCGIGDIEIHPDILLGDVNRYSPYDEQSAGEAVFPVEHQGRRRWVNLLSFETFETGCSFLAPHFQFVPEPGCIALLAVGTIAFLRRQRKQR